MSELLKIMDGDWKPKGKKIWRNMSGSYLHVLGLGEIYRSRRGGRSHIFRLRLCSCSKRFNSGSGSAFERNPESSGIDTGFPNPWPPLLSRGTIAALKLHNSTRLINLCWTTRCCLIFAKKELTSLDTEKQESLVWSELYRTLMTNTFLHAG